MHPTLRHPTINSRAFTTPLIISQFDSPEDHLRANKKSILVLLAALNSIGKTSTTKTSAGNPDKRGRRKKRKLSKRECKGWSRPSLKISSSLMLRLSSPSIISKARSSTESLPTTRAFTKEPRSWPPSKITRRKKANNCFGSRKPKFSKKEKSL